MFKKTFWLPLFFVLIFSGLFVAVDFHNNVPDLISPIKSVQKIQRSNNVWVPMKSLFSIDEAKASPEITAEAAYFIDTTTGTVLFEKNAHQKMPIASLTKIMTVIVTLENMQTNDLIEISQHASEMEPDKMYLQLGEKFTLQELLDGIFLVSANDAAEALAEKATGRREEFMNLMNSKAKMLGMNDTLFINPTGLEEDDPQIEGKLVEQYSTAYDTALMSRYAVSKWPFLTDITSKTQISLPANATHQEYDLNTGINLVSTYPGVVGFKTGYTPSAGLTLVTIARREGHEIIGVLLNSEKRREDAKELLDYSFNKLGIQ